MKDVDLAEKLEKEEFEKGKVEKKQKKEDPDNFAEELGQLEEIQAYLSD
jgi:hypothetical protein